MTCSNLFSYCPQVLIKYQLSGTGDVRRRAPIPACLILSSFLWRDNQKETSTQTCEEWPGSRTVRVGDQHRAGGLGAGSICIGALYHSRFVRVATLAPNSWLPGKGNRRSLLVRFLPRWHWSACCSWPSLEILWPLRPCSVLLVLNPTVGFLSGTTALWF